MKGIPEWNSACTGCRKSHLGKEYGKVLGRVCAKDDGKIKEEISTF